MVDPEAMAGISGEGGDGVPLGPWPSGHTGYVALLGRPNTGKSTLLNTVLDFHLAPVSRKPQTTRRNCIGIYSGEGVQIVFLDAPGVHVPIDALDSAMNRSISRTLEDADVVLCLCDPLRAPGEEDALVAERASCCGKPVFVAINKADSATASQIDAMRGFYGERLPSACFCVISAVTRDGLDRLLGTLAASLPVGPFLYPEDTLTTSMEREIAAELIREVLLEELREEVPHAIAVTIDQWEDRPQEARIVATLNVEREAQKRIVVGREGKTVANIRRSAVTLLRRLCGRRIRLKLWVKVVPKWRRNPRALRDFRFGQDV